MAQRRSHGALSRRGRYFAGGFVVAVEKRVCMCVLPRCACLVPLHAETARTECCDQSKEVGLILARTRLLVNAVVSLEIKSTIASPFGVRLVVLASSKTLNYETSIRNM